MSPRMKSEMTLKSYAILLLGFSTAVVLKMSFSFVAEIWGAGRWFSRAWYFPFNKTFEVRLTLLDDWFLCSGCTHFQDFSTNDIKWCKNSTLLCWPMWRTLWCIYQYDQYLMRGHPIALICDLLVQDIFASTENLGEDTLPLLIFIYIKHDCRWKQNCYFIAVLKWLNQRWL